MTASTKAEHQKSMITRLRRIEGQLRGVQGMIEADQSCEAVAQQLTAARKALDRAFYEMLACSMEVDMEGASSARGVKAAAAKVTRILAKYG